MTEIRRESLSDQVGQYLLALIREQNLKPGDTLPSEASLINRFQVSRPVIREALVQLKSLGIIETKSGKRPVVRSLDSRLLSIFFEYVLALNDAKVFELLEARRGIEIQSASLAAQRRTTAEIKKMQGILGQMKACLVKRDINGYVDLDVELHLQIAEASRNSLIYLLIEAIREPLRQTVVIGLQSRTTLQEIYYLHDLHESIITAIQKEDSPAASDAMAVHFDKAIMAILSREGDGKP